MAQIRCIPFRSTGVGQYYKLAMCIPRSGISDSMTTVIYDDHEVVCLTRTLSLAKDVNVNTMLNKATVLAAVMRDGPALRAKIPDYEDIFARLDENLVIVQSAIASGMQPAKHRLQTPPRKDTASVSLKKFRSDQSTQQTCDRLMSISSAVQGFENTSQRYMPTGWSKTRVSVAGMQPLNLLDPKTARKVNTLCKQTKLEPPTGFVKMHSYHYGKYKNNQLISFLSLSVMNMNNTPGSIAVSIDIASSIDKKHSMSIALESIKKMLRKRRNPCALFAQVAQTDVARAFWAGKLTNTRRASVLTALFSEFDKRYIIYDDTDDMAIFYD